MQKNPEKLAKLKQALEILRDRQNKPSVTPKDLQEFLVFVLETIKKSKQNFDELSKENLETIAESIAYIKSESDSNLKALDEKGEETLKKVESKVETLTKLIDEVRAMKLEKPTSAELIELITPLIPEQVVVEPCAPDTGEDIVDKINSLPINEENQIDASHIKNLPESKGGRGSSLSAINFVKKIGDTMSGDLRGTDFVKTRTFTVTRDGSGYLATIVKTGGRTVTISRNGSNYISSATDGTNTWTVTRDGSNVLTGVTVS